MVLCVSQSCLICFTPWSEGLHASVQVCMSMSPPRSSPSPLNSCTQMCVHPYVYLCAWPAIPYLVLYIGQKVGMHQYMYAYPRQSPGTGRMYIADHKNFIYYCSSRIKAQENLGNCIYDSNVTGIIVFIFELHHWLCKLAVMHKYV